MQKKKGIELNQAFGAVLTVVLLGVLVIVAILLFVNINTAFEDTASVSVINESRALNESGVFLFGAANCSSNDFAIGEILNGSTAQIVNTDNYILTSSNGFLVNNTASAVIADGWNITYSYKWGTEACEAGESLIVQFATFPALVGLVGTIIFLGLVIGVLVASFVFGGRRRV